MILWIQQLKKEKTQIPENLKEQTQRPTIEQPTLHENSSVNEWPLKNFIRPDLEGEKKSTNTNPIVEPVEAETTETALLDGIKAEIPNDEILPPEHQAKAQEVPETDLPPVTVDEFDSM